MNKSGGGAAFDEWGIPILPGGIIAHVRMSDIAKTIHAVTDRRLKAEGFRPLDDRAWLRTRKEPIREVIKFSCIKARVYFEAGFALPYLPGMSGRRVGLSSHPETREYPIWTDCPGKRTFAAKVEPALWTFGGSAEIMHADFRDRVPPRMVCRRMPPDHDVRALPGHYLGLAFTRALLCKRKLAEKGLETFIETHEPSREQAVKLRKMLAETKPL